MRLSKSKINSYLRCPLEFKFRYIDEIEAEPNKYMILGRNVHLIAEKFIKKHEHDLNSIDIENELTKTAFDLDIGYGLESHIDNLSVFFKHIVDNNYKIFSTEEYLLDEKHNFSGICDIILQNENGDLTIVDYKTSNSNTFSKYRLELSYYKLLVENVYQKNVRDGGIFFTKNGRLRLLNVCDEANKRKFLNSAEINEAVKIMYDVKSSIKNNNFYPKKEYTCRFCSYRKICFENENR